MEAVTYRGVVYPAHSDAMGHMTVQYYVAAFDQAVWHLFEMLGWQPQWRTERNEGWADVRYEIDFLRELQVGDLFVVTSQVSAVGTSSLTSVHEMKASDGTVAARIQMKSVYFDLKARKSKALPAVIVDNASRSKTSG